jgi:hypothetical protein
METGAKLDNQPLIKPVPNRRAKVGPNEKVHHPKLKKRILAFQTSDARTIPTWILPNTDRRPRAMPVIVNGLEE